MEPRTLFQKVWDEHVVVQEPGRPAVLYIDLHLIHEVTSPQAFTGLRERGIKVRRPDKTVATMDHSTPTLPKSLWVIDDQAKAQLAMLERNCEEFGIQLYPLGDSRNGIVHVIGPERGFTQPGKTIVCGDSHTSTHGAFGALAFGIGTSEVEHVLASQCLLQRKPNTLEVRVEGQLMPGVTAKDIILALCAEIGTGGATGYVIEYTGSAIENLDMDGRMTVCNMSIEAGARAGMIAPDETTFAYLEGRDYAPKGADWDAALDRWKQLRTDEGATYDKTVVIDANKLEPMITYGTNPGMGMLISETMPTSGSFADASQQAAFEKAMGYMGLEAGKPLLGQKIDVVFIGSCTNSRISDLRLAAGVFSGRKVADGVRTLVVPGSHDIKKQAEAEGLDQIFKEAGAEWREPGCSMCIAMNGDNLEPGQYAVSTSNRNFEGRQGKGGRTFLASPLTAAAAAVTGEVTDPRSLLLS
ncbi:MAG: 3-isopropylmalate dehydratase large subunit [Myxococcales bacterium]|nr:MAG: 3-isopropylmalate dehydratase large subunit [Myxococcales bacterium]